MRRGWLEAQGDGGGSSPRIFIIIILTLMPIMCLCGLVKRFCPHCREQEPDPRMDHMRPPERPTVVPTEGVGVSIPEPPPSYSEVGVYSNPCPAPWALASPCCPGI